MNNGNTQHNFPALTGIRAVAAWLVYLYHSNPFSPERFGNFINTFVSQLHIGVTMFFVLSGFLITLRYYDTSTPTQPWLRKYFQNRIARVYPMYFILTTFTLVVLFLQDKQGQHPLFVYLMNISFLKGFFDDLKFTLIGQGWSLTVEECFYITAPLLFIGFRRSKWFIFLIAIATLASGLLLVFSFQKVSFYGFFSNYTFLFTYTFLGRCVEFLWGAGLVIFFRSHLTKNKAGIILTSSGAMLIIGLIILMSVLDTNTTGECKPAIIAINNFLLPGAIALLFYGLMREKTFVKTILGSSMFVVSGKVSYTFYLIHVGVFYTLINFYLPNDYLLTFLLLNLIALGLWYTIEEPLNRLIRRL